MKRLILIMTLIAFTVIGVAQNKNGTVVPGATSLKYPINFTAADTIDASETYWVLITNNQSYEQTQSVSVTLTTVSGTPSVTAYLDGKISLLDSYTPLDTATAWTSSANNPIVLATSVANKYRYFKVRLTASAAVQKTKVTGLTFTCTYSNPLAISATTGVFSSTVSVGGVLTANGGVTLGSNDDLIGSSTSDITINTNKFTVAGATGNTVVAGTLAVTGAQTNTGLITANGGVTLGAADNLVGSSTSDIVMNTNKFTVAGATGNTLVAGTLAVTGAQSNASTITVTKDADNVILDAGADLHAIDVQINSASKFNVDSTGIVTAAGAINSGGGVNLGTSQALTGTTAITVGSGTATTAITSSDWAIDATGAATGLGAVTSNGVITTSGGVVSTLYNFASATAVAGTGDAITMDFTPDFPALAVGLAVTFVAEAANTTAVTLAIDGGAAKAIGEYNGAYSALDANDIRSGQLVTIVYDGTQWVMMSPSGN